MRSTKTLVPVPFGEWLPDAPAIGNPGLVMARNVVPLTAASYTAMPSLSSFHDALPSGVTGHYSLTDSANVGYEWAGDTSKLYIKAVTASSWTDATKTGATYNPASGAGHWTMTAFGKRVIASNGVDPVQSYLHGTDSRFSDLSPTAPRGRYCAVVRDFLFLGNMAADGLQQRVQWSAIGDPTNWPTVGSDAAIQVQSDYQDLEQTDLGPITGIYGGGFGGTDAAIFCRWGIYRVAYVGSPVIFEFSPAAGAPGTLAPKSVAVAPIATSRGSGFFALYLSNDGFYSYDGSSATAIGAGKFDRLFFQTVNEAALSDVQAMADPQQHLAMWCYKVGTGPERYNRLLLYNWDLSRAATVDLTATPIEWLSERDGGDTIFRLVAFDAAHRMNSFTGPSMACDIVTGDRVLFGGRKSLVQSVRPIADGTPESASVWVAGRDVPTDDVVWSAEVPLNVLGTCPQRTAGRYIRFRFTRPAGTTFRHLQGLEVQAAARGRLR